MFNLTEKSKTIIDQCKVILFSMTASQMVAGMLGAVIILLITHFTEPQPKPIGTVDITRIVNQFVKSQASLNDISQKQQVVLMVQEAVIAGGQDYTAQVNDRLSDFQTTTDTQK